MCVSISPQRFIYTGGAEDGFAIGFINYPRFPTKWSTITLEAKRLAEALMLHLGQHSFTIVTPEESSWFSRRPE